MAVGMPTRIVHFVTTRGAREPLSQSQFGADFGEPSIGTLAIAPRNDAEPTLERARLIDRKPWSDEGLQALIGGAAAIHLYIHGFKTELEEAAVQWADFAQAAGFGQPDAALVVFSWPTRNNVLDAVRLNERRRCSGQSYTLLHAAIVALVSLSRPLHVTAFSMGARALHAAIKKRPGRLWSDLAGVTFVSPEILPRLYAEIASAADQVRSVNGLAYSLSDMVLFAADLVPEELAVPLGRSEKRRAKLDRQRVRAFEALACGGRRWIAQFRDPPDVLDHSPWELPSFACFFGSALASATPKLAPCGSTRHPDCGHVILEHTTCPPQAPGCRKASSACQRFTERSCLD